MEGFKFSGGDSRIRKSLTFKDPTVGELTVSSDEGIVLALLLGEVRLLRRAIESQDEITADYARCPMYWGSHENTCLLPQGHKGQHMYPMTERETGAEHE